MACIYGMQDQTSFYIISASFRLYHGAVLLYQKQRKLKDCLHEGPVKTLLRWRTHEDIAYLKDPWRHCLYEGPMKTLLTWRINKDIAYMKDPWRQEDIAYMKGPWRHMLCEGSILKNTFQSFISLFTYLWSFDFHLIHKKRRGRIKKRKEKERLNLHVWWRTNKKGKISILWLLWEKESIDRIICYHSFTAVLLFSYISWDTNTVFLPVF